MRLSKYLFIVLTVFMLNITSFAQITVEYDMAITPDCDNGWIHIDITGPPPNLVIWSSIDHPTFTSNDLYINGLAEGEYCVWIEDQVCGIFEDCWIIECCEFLEVYGIVSYPDNGLCNNGGITTTTIGGVPPLEYIWSKNNQIIPNETDPNLENLEPGHYSVSVYDQICGSTSKSWEVPVCCYSTEIGISYTLEHEVEGDGSGSIEVSHSNDFSPYTYLWLEDGVTTKNRSNLSEGTYTISIEDRCGNSSTQTIKIYNVCTDNQIEVDVEVYPFLSPSVRRGRITILNPQDIFNSSLEVRMVSPSSGGHGRFSHASYIVFGSGDYELMIRGAGSSCWERTLIHVPEENTELSFNWEDILCPDLGSVEYVSTNANVYPPLVDYYRQCQSEYVYIGGLQPQPLGVSGTYKAIISSVKYDDGIRPIIEHQMEDVVEYHFVHQIGNNVEVISDEIVHPSGKEVSDGRISVELNGEYTYKWIEDELGGDNVCYPNMFIGQWHTGSIATLSHLTEGRYTLVVDPTCLHLIHYELTANCIEFEINTYPCASSGVLGEVEAEAMINGCTQTITYLWSNGATGPILSNVPAGEYCVTASCLGISIRSCMTLNASPEILVENIEHEADCQENWSSEDGSISVSGSGAEPFSYIWSTGDQTCCITDLTRGIYKVTVTDANGCTSSQSVVLLCCQEELEGETGGTYLYEMDPVVIEEIDRIPPTNKHSSDGSIDLTVSGGGIIYYEWSGPNGFHSTEEDIDNLPPGDYTVRVYNGCSEEELTILLRVCDYPITGSYDLDVPCDPSEPILVTVSIRGGHEPYTYTWTPEACIESVLGDGTQVLTFGCINEFVRLSVEDAAGCVQSSVVKLREELERIGYEPIRSEIEPYSCCVRKYNKCNNHTISLKSYAEIVLTNDYPEADPCHAAVYCGNPANEDILGYVSGTISGYGGVQGVNGNGDCIVAVICNFEGVVDNCGDNDGTPMEKVNYEAIVPAAECCLEWDIPDNQIVHVNDDGLEENDIDFGDCLYEIVWEEGDCDLCEFAKHCDATLDGQYFPGDGEEMILGIDVNEAGKCIARFKCEYYKSIGDDNPTRIREFEVEVPISVCNGMAFGAQDPAIISRRKQGVQERELEISLWPNPAEERLFLSLEEKVLDIQLLDMTGQNVGFDVSSGSESGRYIIEINELVEGIYLLIIETENSRYITKQVIKK